MRIEIDLSAANDPDSHRWLDRIVSTVEDGWHVWDTTVGPDPEDLLKTTWIDQCGRSAKWINEVLVAATKRGSWSSGPHTRRVRVTAEPTSGDELQPKEAFHLASEPLIILVENRFSDGAFVERIARELDNSIHELWNRERNPIRVDSVGGSGQMENEIERRMENISFRPRLVIVVDSDRVAPTATISEKTKELQRTCDEMKIPCWVLAKRMAENYLPRVLLRAYKSSTNHNRVVEAWDALSSDQKDYFHMKKGLPKQPSPIEQELFRDLPNKDRCLLSRGFGKDVYKCWKLSIGPIEAELVKRGRGDLEHGIELIRQEI